MDPRQRRLFILIGAVVVMVAGLVSWRASRRRAEADEPPPPLPPSKLTNQQLALIGPRNEDVAVGTGVKPVEPTPIVVAQVVGSGFVDAGVRVAPPVQLTQTGENAQTPQQLQTPPAGTIPLSQKELIRKAINDVKPLVANCYEQALKMNPSLSGTVKLTFTISEYDGGGRMSVGEVPESEVGSPFFEACVLEKVGSAQFPSPGDGGVIRVTYPFHFDPGGGFGGKPEEVP